MASQYKYVDAIEGIWQLIAELTNGEQRPKAKGLLFYVHSCKRILFINPNEQPPRSVRVRRHGDGMLIYTVQSLPDDPAQDHMVEVVSDQDSLVHFREQGHLLSASQFLDKLHDLLGLQAEAD